MTKQALRGGGVPPAGYAISTAPLPSPEEGADSYPPAASSSPLPAGSFEERLVELERMVREIHGMLVAKEGDDTLLPYDARKYMNAVRAAAAGYPAALREYLREYKPRPRGLLG